MFKKKEDLSERSRSLVKNKEVRKLKTDLETLLGQEVSVDTLFPGKGNVSVTKLASKTLLYSVDDVPLVFDLNARNNLVPTLATLWKLGLGGGTHGLRTILVHSPVSTFVLNGADLMLPGVATYAGLEGLKEGEKVAIRVVGNPAPFAVGSSTVRWELLEEVLQTGRRPRGVGVTVLHMFGDELWRACSGGVVPNKGFDLIQVAALQEEVVGGWSAITGQRVGGGGSGAASSDGSDENEDGDEGEDEYDGGNSIENGDGDIGIKEEEEEEEEEEEVSIALSKADVDTALIVHLLRTIKYVVRFDPQVLLANVFWSLVVRSIAAAGQTEQVGIRASSYKKVNLFLAFAARQGLLKLNDNKHTTGVATVSVHEVKQHELFRMHKDAVKVDNPEALRAYCDGSADEYRAGGEGAADAVGGTARGEGSKGGKMRVVSLYKFPKNVKELFGGMGRGRYEYGSEHLTAAEVRGLVFAFVEKRGLVSEKNRGQIDLPRTDALSRFIGPKKIAKERKDKEGKETRKAEAAAKKKGEGSGGAAAVDPRDAPLPSNLNEMTLTSGYDDEEEDEEEGCVMATGMGAGIGMGSGGTHSGAQWPRAGGMGLVGGVWMGSSSGTVSGGSKQRPKTGPKAAGGQASGGSKQTFPLQQGSQQGSQGAMDPGVWKWKPVSLPKSAPKLSPKPISTPVCESSGGEGGGGGGADSGVVRMAAVEAEVDMLSRDELLKAFLNKLSPYSAIVQPGKSPVIRSGGLPTIHIEVLSRMGNKVVTVVRGLEAYGYECKEVARDFQKRFACSASVSPVTGQPQLREVVVQGNWADELRTHLVQSCLVPSNLVESKLGKNVKPKRKA